MKADGTVADVIPRTNSFVRDAAGNMYWVDRAATTTIKKGTAGGAITTLVSSGLRSVQWMASSSDGTLFLMDAGDLKRVTPPGIMTTLAAKVSAATTPPANVNQPHYQMGLHAGRDGNVYVAVSEERLVLKVSPGGKRSVAAHSQTPWAPSGVLLDRDGMLWMLEYMPNNDMRVVRVESDGRQQAFSLPAR
jgi:sugar lactone lactonase YvrE